MESMDSTTPPSSLKGGLIQKLRSMVKQCIDCSQYGNAVFWADKLITLSNEDVQDYYTLCRALFCNNQYKRCTHIIKQHGFERFPAFRLLASRCHYELREWQTALDILEGGDYLKYSAPGKPKPRRTPKKSGDSKSVDWGMRECQIESCIHLMMGKVYEALENRGLAVNNFREALRHDVMCYEAFERLVQHHLLTSAEEQELLESLPISEQCSADEGELVTLLYMNKLKKYQRVSDHGRHSSNHLSLCLARNCETQIDWAERLFYNCQYQQCYTITRGILRKDPFFMPCLLLHISVLVELSKANELFSLAHNLIDYHPEWALSWLAVGCYYYLIGKQDPARRYLMRAINIDRMFGPCWLINGHSFAVEGEHDQAMAAYFTATKLMRGLHLPLLYIGLEYGITSNLTLADKFANEALAIAPDDPCTLHELGVIAFNNNEFESADRFFQSALQKIHPLEKEVLTHKWEPLFNNIGHVHRKLERYREALELHERALALVPNNPATLSAIGLVQCYLLRWDEAIVSFHQALALKREDSFTVAMLKVAIDRLVATSHTSLLANFEHVDVASLSMANAGGLATGRRVSATMTPSATGVSPVKNFNRLLTELGEGDHMEDLTEDFPPSETTNSSIEIDFL